MSVIGKRRYHGPAPGHGTRRARTLRTTKEGCLATCPGTRPHRFRPDAGPSVSVTTRDGRVRARLAELGLELHGPHPPHDPLDAVVVHGGVARTSGQLPRIAGELTCTGTLGTTVSVEEGRAAAAVCVLNALAVLEEALGSLDRVERVLWLTGYVASAPDFHQQPGVVDGASQVLFDVFGATGRHTRSAIGVAALPRGGAVELEMAVAVVAGGGR